MTDRLYNIHDDDNNGGRPFRPRHRNDAVAPLIPPPTVGQIWEGEIVRIESYGAFCSFGGQHHQRQRRAWQGLIHISQLSESRVEKVEDVVDRGDNVWVIVLEVERQEPANSRYRIKLSMKDVSQDGTRQDLKQLKDQKEHITNQLETNLNSMIGMGVAIDPMERLVLKNDSRNTNTFRGGYTLVGDDEGEPESQNHTINTTNTNATDSNTVRTAPMGRGRGATLPAWMTTTTSMNNEGPTGGATGTITKVVKKALMRSDHKNVEEKGKYSDSDDDYKNKRSYLKRKKEDRKRHKKKRRERRHYRDDHDDLHNSSKNSAVSEDQIDQKKERHDFKKRQRRHVHKSTDESDSNGTISRRHRHHRKDRKHSKDEKKKQERKRRHRDYNDDDNDRDYSRRSSRHRRYESDVISIRSASNERRGGSISSSSNGSTLNISKRYDSYLENSNRLRYRSSECDGDGKGDGNDASNKKGRKHKQQHDRGRHRSRSNDSNRNHSVESRTSGRLK